MAGTGNKLINSLERDWRDALCAKDMEKLRALVHPRFVLIGTRSSGPFTMDRDEWLEAIQRRELVTIELEITQADQYDQVIVGTVRASWKINYLGRQVEDCVLLTDVWVLDEGRWQVVRRHSSPAPPGSCD